MNRLVPALALLVAAGLPAGSYAAPPAYHVVRRIPVGGEGGWDYLTADPAHHRVFVSRGSHVMVLDARSGAVAGDIGDTPGVHGIALAPELDHGFTSNGRDSSVTMFDLTTLKTLRRVHLDQRGPDAIVYDAVSKRVFTFNGGSNSTTALDAKSGDVIGTLPLDGRPEFAVSGGDGRMFVNLEDSSAVVAFDARTLKPIARWPLAPGDGPSGLAIDRAHHRLFSGCHNRIMVVMDADNGHVVDTLSIGQGVDATAFDPGTGLAFSSNGDGTLTVAHEDSPDRFTPVAQVPTERGARTMALDPDTHHAFLATAQFGPRPDPTPDNPRPRPPMVPGSFVILEVAP
ncbi:MAG TPA: YncE family protein [Candidatus Eisenbacteria bacterium]|nr:YncE family protein [Candidatus Eisenbacteria bacterium]